MKEALWRAVARFCNIPVVRDSLVDYALKRPYTHITKGDDVYMERYWLFNPYQFGEKKDWRRRFPSVRLHWIRRPDQDRHLHDHPWNARTIILRGWYVERREREPIRCGKFEHRRIALTNLSAGDTAPIKYGEYHAIDQVSEHGAWTLFITWKYQGTWGFNVDGKKVPWKTYLGVDK